MIGALLLALVAAQAGPPQDVGMGPPPGGPGMGPPPGMGRPQASLADQVATPAFAALLVSQGMSADGAAAVRRAAVPRDEAADRAALAAADRSVAAAAADPADIGALKAALARRDRLVAAQAGARSAALLALLRPLAARDRAVLLAVIGTGGAGQGGFGGPGGPPPGGGPGFGPPPGGPPPGRRG